MKPGAQVLTTYHEAESRPTGSQDRKQSAVTSSSPGGALPARHSSLKTHTHSPGNGLYQHTHTHSWAKQPTLMRIHKHRHACKEMGHINSGRQECGQTQTHQHTLKSSNKPEITSSVHVNLTPPTPTHTATGKGDHRICRAVQWILISGRRAFLSLLQRGFPCLGDTLRQACGSWTGRKGLQDTGGTRLERTHEAAGTVVCQKRVGLRDEPTIMWTQHVN